MRKPWWLLFAAIALAGTSASYAYWPFGGQNTGSSVASGVMDGVADKIYQQQRQCENCD